MKVITIGRSTENSDIVVNDEKVSRNHLQMVMDDNGNYSVVDLGSTNGTYVNGQRISGEVRLRLGDEVRIGQTVLPWQNYFVTSSQQPIVNPPMPPQPHKPNPNRTWVYIVIGAALLLLIGGGVAWKIYHDKQNEQIEQEERDKKDRQEQQLEREANDARVEAARLSEEAEIAARKAEEAARKAAETNSEKDKAFAEEMKIKAEEANRLARLKEDEWKNMNKKLDEANNAMRLAEEERDKAMDKSTNDSIARVEAERKALDAEKEAELTRQFYRLISQVQPKILIWETDYFQKICNEMKWKVGENEDKKEYIINRFEEGDKDQKQRIISAVEKVLGQQKKEAAVAKPVEENAPVSTKELELVANDTTIKE